MPEIHKSQQSGEMSKRLVEFILMQAQNTLLFLGKSGHGEGMPPKNLPLAQMFIDQLEMVQFKTEGNLDSEEERLLTATLTDLRLAYVEAAREPAQPAAPPSDAAPKSEQAPAKSAEAPAAASESGQPESAQPEDRKKFHKSYGA
ncbi:MAG: DUF1844 domain-containing protein [Verrucomicrobiales bacterium]